MRFFGAMAMLSPSLLLACAPLVQADVDTQGQSTAAGAGSSGSTGTTEPGSGPPDGPDDGPDDGDTRGPDDGDTGGPDGGPDDGGTESTDDDGNDATDDDGSEPVCGNSNVEVGEDCDDGNDDNTDRCTELCTPPSCADGIVSGTESGIDCGGDRCDACPVGSGCSTTGDCESGLTCGPVNLACVYPTSCLGVQALDLNADSGSFEIDPEGDGTHFEVHCNMTYDGGGWTRVDDENFDNVDPGWSFTQTTDCGGIDDILGGYELLGQDDELTRTVELMGVPHTEAALRADFVFIDSWDGEVAIGQLDGANAWEQSHAFGETSNICGGGEWGDSEQVLIGSVAHSDATAGVRITTTLDEARNNESWGIDSLRILVR